MLEFMADVMPGWFTFWQAGGLTFNPKSAAEYIAHRILSREN